MYQSKHNNGVYSDDYILLAKKQFEIYVQDLKRGNYVLAKPQWLGSKQRDKIGFVINMWDRKNDSYPGVEAEQTDASGVDDVSNRVGAGAVQVLLIFPRLNELPAR